jgi:hypothetical protein
MSIPGVNTAQYLNKYSTRAVTDFLQPHSSLDRIYLIFLTFWFCTSIFFIQVPWLRVGAFSGTILLLFLSNLERKRANKNLSLLGSTIKLFIIALLIGFFTGDAAVSVPISFPFELTYLEFESFILVCTFLFAFILSSFHLSLLEKYGLKGYQAFIKSLLRGFWLLGIGLYLLVAFNVLKSNTPIFTPLWEDYLLLVLILYLLTSFLPYSFNPLINSISKGNPIINYRDSALGATISLIILDFLFHRFTYDIWDSLIPFLFVTGFILLIIREKNLPNYEQVLAKSISKTKELSKVIDQSTFDKIEDVFTVNKPINLLQKSSTLLAEKNALIVPLSISNDFVTVEAIGDLSINLKDSIGKVKKESTKKITFMLPLKEWESLTKKMNRTKLSEVEIQKYLPDISSQKEFLDDLEASFTSYKGKIQTEGLVKIENNFNLIKSNYSLNLSDSIKEFNFPGIKVIEEPDSQLFKFGSIEAIDVKKSLPDNTDAKYFNLKMPFISATEIEYDGKYLLLNLPFVSALETPKGLILKIFGFDVSEGNTQEILEDLNRILEVQAKFSNYYNLRMSNIFAADDDPRLILTQDPNDNKPKLLVAGSEDAIFIDEEKPLALPLKTETQEETIDDDEDIIDIPESEIEIIEIPTKGDKDVPSITNMDQKISQLMKRIDKISKDEFIEYMGFQSHNEFLEWLTNLPEDSAIRVEDDVVWFK